MRGSASAGSSMSQAYLRGELSRAKSEIDELRRANADLVTNMNSMDLRHTELISQFLQKDNRVTDFLLSRALSGWAGAGAPPPPASDIDAGSSQQSMVESRVVKELQEKLSSKSEKLKLLEGEARRLTIDFQAKMASFQEEKQRILQLLDDSQLEASVYKERHDQLQSDLKQKDSDLEEVRQRSERLHAKVMELERTRSVSDIVKHECPDRAISELCSI